MAMKISPRILLLWTFIMVSSPTDSATKQYSLADHQWKNRLVVAFAAKEDTQSDAVHSWVLSNTCALAERDVEVYLIVNSRSAALTTETSSLDADSIRLLTEQRRFELAPIELMLIGKDGGIKGYTNSLSGLDEFIVQIDGMPMRRSEASTQSERCP